MAPTSHDRSALDAAWRRAEARRHFWDAHHDELTRAYPINSWPFIMVRHRPGSGSDVACAADPRRRPPCSRHLDRSDGHRPPQAQLVVRGSGTEASVAPGDRSRRASAALDTYGTPAPARRTKNVYSVGAPAIETVPPPIVTCPGPPGVTLTTLANCWMPPGRSTSALLLERAAHDLAVRLRG